MSIIPEGLYYNREYITAEFQQEIMEEIYAGEWNFGLRKSLSRRTQHYVHYYEYSNPNERRDAPPMPPKIKQLAEHLVRNGVLSKMPEQVLVNEYDRKQGITPHADHPQFGEEVAIISLWAPALMNFTNGETTFPVVLEPQSLSLMSGEARHKWKHSIDDHVNISLGGWKYKKPSDYKRLSLTYRYYVSP
jgi:alkylated DNA repair dioxygenase AlkB